MNDLCGTDHRPPRCGGGHITVPLGCPWEQFGLAILAEVHTNHYDYAGRHEDLVDTVCEYRREFVSDHYKTEHPVVRVHPETGKRVRLQARITKPENTIRWTWQAGNLAIWDNRATQHYAVADYDDPYRRLNRVALAGDIPVDVHGRRSRAVAGDASAFSDVISPIVLAS